MITYLKIKNEFLLNKLEMKELRALQKERNIIMLILLINRITFFTKFLKKISQHYC